MIKNEKVSPLQSMFLFVLFNSQPLSGAEIVKRLEKDIGQEWVPSAGARYKILQYLESEKLIEKTISKGQDPVDKRVSKYRLSTKGKDMVEILSNQVSKVVAFVSDCCPQYCDNVLIIRKEDLKNDPEKKS
ncbi:MAG: hypothetical protein HeimC3_10230 [Candidatus Heimdallarchaeota archaeon LC_3]|nr:MAG: hypothetical protein HeimC3_10230 [Candidatus Heimdallarchaeota archaeon LC_3]